MHKIYVQIFLRVAMFSLFYIHFFGENGNCNFIVDNFQFGIDYLKSEHFTSRSMLSLLLVMYEIISIDIFIKWIYLLCVISKHYSWCWILKWNEHIFSSDVWRGFSKVYTRGGNFSCTVTFFWVDSLKCFQKPNAHEIVY